MGSGWAYSASRARGSRGGTALVAVCETWVEAMPCLLSPAHALFPSKIFCTSRRSPADPQFSPLKSLSVTSELTSKIAPVPTFLLPFLKIWPPLHEDMIHRSPTFRAEAKGWAVLPARCWRSGCAPRSCPTRQSGGRYARIAPTTVPSFSTGFVSSFRSYASFFGGALSAPELA